MTDIKRLRELEAKATPAPWAVGMRNGANACNVFARTGKDWMHDPSVCSVYGIWQNRSIDECERCEGMPNAQLIVELRNALPALLDELEAARKALTTIRDEHVSENGHFCRMCGAEGGRWPCGTHLEAKAALSAHAAAGKGGGQNES